ncbi:phosphoribosylglycinamide formyltransferase [Geovibrio thiophilus]|uniref:Phosphoribosylglycinamide formyltransferase n=1 Tax=Geovibrio thiophilus TaxID=139438 RepID=A0A410JV36_9BACT|nr:phosphoribosylglycinamide formyltransferase [Geovibrio thiophilus]QAR31915.1 phosphoribosylglycinamide formyltransferase [Geovibrio thiophilus]
MRIGILLSGRGSNFKAIKAAIDNGEIKNAEIAAVISNKSDAAGLAYAKECGLKTVYLNHKDFDGREAYDREIVKHLSESGVDLVCLAGFMRIISPYFVEQYRNRIINIHPSLLPAFPGLDAQKQALDYGVKFAGCTVHFVDEKMDSGAIILQKCVPVKDDDTEETLSARILEEEHRAYPEAVRLIAEGRLKTEGRHVKIL